MKFQSMNNPKESADDSRITFEAGQCGGRPCIRGMRIRVSDILDMLADGVSAESILGDFPDLEPEDIAAVLRHAAERVKWLHG
jgi:uncharacterized protein (DUF433 family)